MRAGNGSFAIPRPAARAATWKSMSTSCSASPCGRCKLGFATGRHLAGCGYSGGGHPRTCGGQTLGVAVTAAGAGPVRLQQSLSPGGPLIGSALAAFIVYGLMSRKDWRTVTAHFNDVNFDIADLEQRLIPTLRAAGIERIGRIILARSLVADCRNFLAGLLPFTKAGDGISQSGSGQRRR